MVSTVWRSKCGQCGVGLRIPANTLTQTVRCPACRSTFRVEQRAKANTSTSGDSFAEIQPVTAGPKKSARGRWIGSGIAVLILLTLSAMGFAYRDRLFPAKPPAVPPPPQVAVVPDEPKKEPSAEKPATKEKPKPAVKPPAKAPEIYPRRMLAIFANQYLYANPVSYGSAKRSGAVLLERLADKYRIPKEQQFLVTDSRVGRASELPVKPIIQAAIEQFLATSRGQDRVILLFAGHAKVLDGKCYLVPLEGDLAKSDTLIELDWVFARLKDSKARQKVFIVDVCRFDPGRGAERPSPGVMDPALEAALKRPPDGVQIWSACSASEYSQEFRYQTFDGLEVEGGLFLNQILNAFQKHGVPTPKPEDSIPIETLANHVNAMTAAMAGSVRKLPQTPFLAGKERDSAAAYDPKEPQAGRLKLPKVGDPADLKLVQSIVSEIRLPPIKGVGVDETPIDDISGVMPFAAAALKGYEADYSSKDELLNAFDKYPLRATVLKAVQMLERHAKGEIRLGQTTKNVPPLPQSLAAPVDDAKKRQVEKTQRDGPAAMIVELEDAMAALEKLESARNEESPRWKANYDYVLAMVKCRYAHINEYDYMLGQIRKDNLPPRDDKLFNGWRLASQEKLSSPSDIRAKAEEAAALFDRIIKEHPGTPWEVLARRERLTTLGLVWLPASVRK